MNRSVILSIIALNVLVIGTIVAVAFFGSGGYDPQPEIQAETPSALSGNFVLALSWQPAFCETRSRVPECKSQTEARADTRQFSLHGLWPEDRYCGVDAETRRTDEASDWEDLPPVALSPELRAALDIAMPGTQSGLDGTNGPSTAHAQGAMPKPITPPRWRWSMPSTPRRCRHCLTAISAIPYPPPALSMSSTKPSVMAPASASRSNASPTAAAG